MPPPGVPHAFRPAILSGWRWLRTLEARTSGAGYLPSSMARKLARCGGGVLIPHVRRALLVCSRLLMPVCSCPMDATAPLMLGLARWWGRGVEQIVLCCRYRRVLSQY
jgi:hypothetical protein